MEPIKPSHDTDLSTTRPGKWQQAGVWLLVILGLLGVALLIDFGRNAAAGDDLVPWEAGLDRGSELARETGKPMLVNFTADWCPPCQEMKRTVFSKPYVAATISDNYVPVKVDLTVQRPGTPAAQAAERYGIPGVPTYLLLDADGNAISGRVGLISEDEMLAWLETQK